MPYTIPKCLRCCFDWKECVLRPTYANNLHFGCEFCSTRFAIPNYFCKVGVTSVQFLCDCIVIAQAFELKMNKTLLLFVRTVYML